MLHKMRQMILLLGLFSSFVLLATGFSPLVMGLHIQGYWLMIHAIFAPVFIGCVAIIAITREEQAGGSAMFVFLLFISLPLALSMALSMVPVFGTDGQVVLLRLHQICAVVFSLALLLEIYLRMRAKVAKGIRS